MTLGLIPLAVYLLGQESPTPTGFQLIDLLTTLGVSGAFVFLYFDERKERRAAQAQISQLLREIIPALTESTGTLERVQDSMEQQVKAASPETNLLTEVHSLLEEMRQQRKG